MTKNQKIIKRARQALEQRQELDYKHFLTVIHKYQKKITQEYRKIWFRSSAPERKYKHYLKKCGRRYE